MKHPTNSNYTWASNMLRSEAERLQDQGSDGLIGPVSQAGESVRKFHDFIGWYRPEVETQEKTSASA